MNWRSIIVHFLWNSSIERKRVLSALVGCFWDYAIQLTSIHFPSLLIQTRNTNSNPICHLKNDISSQNHVADGKIFCKKSVNVFNVILFIAFEQIKDTHFFSTKGNKFLGNVNSIEMSSCWKFQNLSTFSLINWWLF